MNKLILGLITLLWATATFGQPAANVEKVWINGSRGRLAAISQMPVSTAKGRHIPVVILMHGYGDRKETPLLAALADSLAAQGIGSIRFDFNSHGESEGASEDMTVPNELEDAACVYRYLRSLPQVGRIGLAGHSQGGVVTSMLAGKLGRKAISGVVLFAPAAVLREDAIRGNTLGVGYNPLNPPEYITIGNRRLGRNYIQTAFSLPIYETARQYRGPACLLHGTGDRIAPYSYSERYHDIWKKSTLHLFDGADHGLYPDTQKAVGIATAFFCKTLQ